jgi:asparagine synthase (glutamine-hydrolysing)
MGFPVPFAKWMRGPWNDVVREVLLDRRARERDLVRPSAVDTLLDDAHCGAPGAADALWSLLNLELWHRTFIDGDGIQTLPQPRTSRQPTGHARAAAAAAESRGA